MLANISKSQKITVMAGVMLAMLLSALDQTIVATAMPRIVEELQGLEHLSWVFTSYMLASTVTVPIYGRKGFYLAGIVIFLIGSILSGLSQNMAQLIAFRALQGIGGGAMMANSFAIIADIFPPRERGRWQGLMGGVFGLASVLGPFLGGWLTDNASWRWNFYINIPVGLFALITIWTFMPKIASDIKDRSIDYLGAVLLILGLVPLLLALVWGGNEYAWNSSQIISLFVFSLVSLVSFGFTETKVKEPILPLSLFKNRIFTVSAFITFLTAMGMFGAILYIPLFAQGVLGVSATNSGTILTPLMFGLILSSIISGQIISRTGKYKLLAVVGMAIVTVAMYLLSQMTAGTTQSDLVFRMILTGVGLGITMPIFTIAVQNAFNHSQIGVVTASTQLFRSIGGTVGVAIMGSVLNNALTAKMQTLATDPFVTTLSTINPHFSVATLSSNNIQGLLSPQMNAQISDRLSMFPQQIQPQAVMQFTLFLNRIKEALASSIGQVFFIGTFLMGLAFIASFFLKEVRLRSTNQRRSIMEEAGVELAVEEGEFPAKSEPVIR